MEGIVIRISELSRRTGVSLRSLRYYEEKGLLKPKRLDNDYRIYDETDVERVRVIQLYFRMGLNIKEINDFFHCAYDEIKYDCLPNAIQLAERKLEEIRMQIKVLSQAKAHLEGNIKLWKEFHKGEGSYE